MPKIFITGGVGSGKTFSSRLIANSIGSDYYALDEIFFDFKSSEYMKKRLPEERDAMLLNLISSESWVIEGWHFGDWVIPIYQNIDYVILLDTPLAKRRFRVIHRFCRRKLGLIYDPVPMSGILHLVKLLKWTKRSNVTRHENDILENCQSTCHIERVNYNLNPDNIPTIFK